MKKLLLILSLFISLNCFGGGAGTSGDPYRIWTWAGLDSVRYHLSSYFILMTNLSSSTTGYSTYASSTANSNAGWLPVGTFTGNLNGQGKTISDLVATGTERRGLFAFITEGAVISNLGIVNANITSTNDRAGILGSVNGTCTISNCYSTGSVTAYYAGGLLGSWAGSYTITNCYSTASVTGGGYAGGLIGLVYANVTNCYSTGAISGAGEKSGLVGIVISGTVSGCFWDKETSGITAAGAGTGKTTSEMKTLATFTGASWSIANKSSWVNEAWYIDATVDYPRLGWEHTAAPSSNVKSWNGVLRVGIKNINGVTNANIKSINGVQ